MSSGTPGNILQRSVKVWHALCMCVLLMSFTGLSTYYLSNNTENFQYSNIRTQRDLVDKHMQPLEESMRGLEYRMSESEGRINMQVKESQSLNRKLENLMYEASPRVMMQMAKDTAQLEHQKLQEKLGSITQNASPSININPVINAGVGAHGKSNKEIKDTSQ